MGGECWVLTHRTRLSFSLEPFYDLATEMVSTATSLVGVQQQVKGHGAVKIPRGFLDEVILLVGGERERGADWEGMTSASRAIASAQLIRCGY